ncbi:hypothetical protein L1987_76192 [Smallanthus sonchifolius]|uniref:Uncharacterized protein n=1 Tax=Smallanthus sonchifolius TaxID=185202 RepID=A0ACB9A7V7_9ASTR|nr:hypothetical protein L1987_76192 [Smallanthus sonchifolius]
MFRPDVSVVGWGVTCCQPSYEQNTSRREDSSHRDLSRFFFYLLFLIKFSIAAAGISFAHLTKDRINRRSCRFRWKLEAIL